MRGQLKVLVLATLAVVGLNLALAQSQFQFGGGAGGLGALLGKDNRSDPLALLRNPDVKKELKLSEDDSNKVDVAVWKALKDVLNEDQFGRLRQIDLQQRDYQAFADPVVQDELKLDAEQKTHLKTILQDSDKEFNGAIKSLQEGIKNMQEGGGVNWVVLAASYERLGTLKKETKERCTEVLTMVQRRNWQEMIGDEFKFPSLKFDIPDPSKIKADIFKNQKKGGKKGQ